MNDPPHTVDRRSGRRAGHSGRGDGDEGLIVGYLSTCNLNEGRRNTNWAQRLLFASPTASVQAFLPRDAEVDLALPWNVSTRRASLPTLLGFYIGAALWLTGGRGRRAEVIVTDRSAVSVVAAVVKGKRAWVLDMWDSPQKELVTRFAAGRGPRTVVRRLASRFKVAALRVAVRRADAVVVSVHANALRGLNIRGEVHLFENAIDLEMLPQPAADGDRAGRKICYVTGEFLSDRGGDVLLAAIELLHASGEPPVEVHLIGRLPDDLADRVRSSPASSWFHLRGSLSLERTHAEIRDSAIGVIPFHTNADLDQTYPIKAIEYMALGAVVVASRLPGLSRQLAEGDAGELVEPGDPEDLARALRSILDDGERQGQLRGAGFRRAQQLDAADKADRVYAVLAATRRVETAAR